MTLTIYGDFNCPFSALASVRADVLLACGHEILWRAIQHDPSIRADGEPVDGDLAAMLAKELVTIEELSQRDVRLRLITPPIRSNTALASAALAVAGDDSHRLRRRLFAAVWAEGRNIGRIAELHRLGVDAYAVGGARRWQQQFEALARPVTPTLVLPDGYVVRGLGALARLAELAAVVPT